MNESPKQEPDRVVWDKAIAEGAKEKRPLPEIVADKEAIHKALRESRMRRTTKVKAHVLP